MLSSSFTHLQKAMQNKSYSLGQLLPVWPQSRLLAGSRHQNLIQEIQKLSALPEAHFKVLYRSAISHYAEFVQVIPEEAQSALGGLLNLGLARGVLGLRQFTEEAGGKADADPLMNYAIFTAGLFFDVAKVVSQQKMVISDDGGNYLREWHPFSGSLVEQGAEFYKMYPYDATIYQALNHQTAALLARQLMPREGFLWLSSDLELLIDWLDTLRGDHAEGGRRIFRALSLIRQEDLLALIKSLNSIPVEVITPKEPQLDDQFFLWFKENWINRAFPINTSDAQVHLVETDGQKLLYLNNDLFKRFLETKKISADANKLAADFNQRFGVDVNTTPGRGEYAAFLMQRGTQKSIQVRNGMFAFGCLFLIDLDTVGVPLISPLQKEIMNAYQQHRKLPGISASVSAAVPERRYDAGFKMGR